MKITELLDAHQPGIGPDADDQDVLRPVGDLLHLGQAEVEWPRRR